MRSDLLKTVLVLLVDAEWNRRQVNKYKRVVSAAHFSVPGATVEGIEYYEDRKLDKAQIIKFSTCQYIERVPPWIVSLMLT